MGACLLRRSQTCGGPPEQEEQKKIKNRAWHTVYFGGGMEMAVCVRTGPNQAHVRITPPPRGTTPQARGEYTVMSTELLVSVSPSMSTYTHTHAHRVSGLSERVRERKSVVGREGDVLFYFIGREREREGSECGCK